MAAKKFQKYSVKITDKYICESKYLICSFLLMPLIKTPPPPPAGFYHYHPNRRKSPIPAKQRFLKVYFFLSRKEWGRRIMELKKLPKLNLRESWSQVLINFPIFVTFTFLVSVLLGNNLASSMLKGEGTLT